MGSVSGGGVRGSESDRWKRGLLGRVDNAFFCQSADDTGYTASVTGLSAKNYVRREKDSAHTCHAETPVG